MQFCFQCADGDELFGMCMYLCVCFQFSSAARVQAYGMWHILAICWSNRFCHAVIMVCLRTCLPDESEARDFEILSSFLSG